MIALSQEKHASRKYAAKVDTFGTIDLCAWSVAPGVFRFQTRWPDIAEKFRHRGSARLVASSVGGGYLRIFEEPMEPKRARDLVRRFLAVPNKPFFGRKGALSRRNRHEGSRQPKDVS
jgi:hypothetical protein